MAKLYIDEDSCHDRAIINFSHSIPLRLREKEIWLESEDVSSWNENRDARKKRAAEAKSKSKGCTGWFERYDTTCVHRQRLDLESRKSDMTPSDVKKSKAYMTSARNMRRVNWNERNIKVAIRDAGRKQRMEEFHNDLRDYWHINMDDFERLAPGRIQRSKSRLWVASRICVDSQRSPAKNCVTAK
ncbi:hypothetical protein AGABI2DRAFT_175695 [Agaricus bisporus var. bisporus H97]|uniref:hypothetical protein n=1 Tax=Agaricus bisporus var. bisporus (strain H97 / ATCC MYA-4626 / FGSC 10389) TaxID=936046 RepID=UPI00029F57E1|nr:hypothetical protein AGABI2DRAFT_175695 [Agaricus bisporus var. bisporus H97]EKV50976.1 hypothetical protein AGABI2DRAFT_175695 [Agaricus bisporus var. bisporus H97]